MICDNRHTLRFCMDACCRLQVCQQQRGCSASANSEQAAAYLMARDHGVRDLAPLALANMNVGMAQPIVRDADFCSETKKLSALRQFSCTYRLLCVYEVWGTKGCMQQRTNIVIGQRLGLVLPPFKLARFVLGCKAGDCSDRSHAEI